MRASAFKITASGPKRLSYDITEHGFAPRFFLERAPRQYRKQKTLRTDSTDSVTRHIHPIHRIQLPSRTPTAGHVDRARPSSELTFDAAALARHRARIITDDVRLHSPSHISPCPIRRRGDCRRDDGWLRVGVAERVRTM